MRVPYLEERGRHLFLGQVSLNVVYCFLREGLREREIESKTEREGGMEKSMGGGGEREDGHVTVISSPVYHVKCFR